MGMVKSRNKFSLGPYQAEQVTCNKGGEYVSTTVILKCCLPLSENLLAKLI